MRTCYFSRDVIAGCFECGGNEFIWNAKNAQAVAAKHCDRTGHDTWVDVNMCIRYTRKAAAGKEGSDDAR